MEEKSGEANAELHDRLEQMIAQEDEMVDKIDEPVSWMMRKVKQVKQHVLQAATTEEVDACAQYSIDIEADGNWTCDTTIVECRMTDEAVDAMYADAMTSDLMTEEDVDTAVEMSEAFVNAFYELVCMPTDEAWVIEWEVLANKKASKPVVAAKNTALMQKRAKQMSLAKAIAANKAEDHMNQYFAYGAGAVTFACVASLALFCSKRKQMATEDEGFHRV